MAIDPTTELVRFQQFIGEHLARGDTLSPEEALDLWRLENPAEGSDEEELEAIREALADMDAGDRGIPLEEFERKFCRRHGLSP